MLPYGQDKSPNLSTFFPRSSNKEKLRYSSFQLYISSTGNTVLSFGLHTLVLKKHTKKPHSLSSSKTASSITHTTLQHKSLPCLV